MAWTSRVLVWGCLLGAAAPGALPKARAEEPDARAATQLKASQPTRGEEAFKNALTRLASPEPAERVAAADELGRRGLRFRKQIGDVLRPMLGKDPDASVRAAAGRALGRLGAREATPELTQALDDPSPEVRSVAAAALWRLPDRAAVPTLIEHTRDVDGKVREWSATALGAASDAQAVVPLMDRLGDAERSVRLAAIRSLGRLSAGAALPALQQYLSSERDEEEKTEVVNAVVAIDSHDRVPTLLAMYAAAINDVPQKKRLLSALGRVGDEQALPMLRKVSGERDARGLNVPATAAVAAVLARIGDAGAK